MLRIIATPVGTLSHLRLSDSLSPLALCFCKPHYFSFCGYCFWGKRAPDHCLLVIASLDRLATKLAKLTHRANQVSGVGCTPRSALLNMLHSSGGAVSIVFTTFVSVGYPLLNLTPYTLPSALHYRAEGKAYYKGFRLPFLEVPSAPASRALSARLV